MKNLLSGYFLMMVVLAGCGTPPSHTSQANARLTDTESATSQQNSVSNTFVTTHPNPINFSIRYGGLKLSAISDSAGNVTILDYPSEWHGRVTLTRFDGNSDYPPFSKSHCEIIRSMAASGFGSMIRNAYRSLLIFEIPAFLSSEFIGAVQESALSDGIKLSIPVVKNAVDSMNSVIDLSLTDISIARTIANTSMLAEQLHLGYNGAEIDPFHKQVIVTSGDILCDLASGEAILTMTYPIVGESRTLRVIYGPLEVKLAP